MHIGTLTDIIKGGEQAPIWLAALLANRCMATDRAGGRAVHWRCRSGKALYTNSARDAEHIHPFGVSLRRGETLAVWWRPGETGYTLEVYDETGIAAIA